MATNSSDNIVHLNEVIVAMVPFPEYSHLNQLFIVARFIASHNIPVHLLSLGEQSQNFKLRVQGCLEFSNIHFNDLVLPSETEDTEYAGDDLPPIVSLLKKLNDPIYKTCLELSINAKRLIIIHDNPMTTAMGDVLSFPNVESYIFHSIPAFTRYSLFRQCIDSVDDDHEEILPQLQDELPTTESCFGQYMALFVRIEREWKLNAGEIMNSCREVEGKYLDLLAHESIDKKPLWAVGPLHMLLLESHNSSNTTRHECLEYLDMQDVNSVIFVSFGTNTKLSQEQVNEIALGLEQSNHRFIWVLRQADKKTDMKKVEEKDGKIELPKEFEERVKGRGMVVRNWVPQLEILGHPSTGGFLSHCGWNSCLESISMGVPIADWPNSADQPYNAVFVTSVLKVGISVCSWDRREELATATAVEKAVKTLMATTEGEEMRQRAMELSNKIKNSVSRGGLARKEMESFISCITR
ncbi:PREDICTED: zeatin O-glucosyltransferase-like [Nicotiana attenuata]|uniref:Glycosyltransferase n=1 Tax=Nicotiana attenuata TaxID=49451 RepID=A0A2I2MNE4_NICAT|nr:PREDICTED: zeatin O-glucosyltransferase-like [Nicotiana attenuata]AQQ16653.1 UDP-glycosyltransferase g13945 [Nicotiana attenuata]